VETVIVAIGQEVDRKPLKGLEVNRDGTVLIDPETGETSMNGVFAGGDVVTGPGWAIDAIAAGKKGAEAIAQCLS
jgi:formate dehydrogenase major subunit